MNKTNERRGAAASSFMFKLLESVGAQGISFVVGVILARLLSPDNYGTLTRLTVYVAVAQILVQSGLTTALIQKKDVDERDYSSVFWFCLSAAAAAYLLLFLCAPAIAASYDTPMLAPMLRVLALVLFPGALLTVQNAVIAREMRFRRLMIATLLTTSFSGLTGIGMALGGMGVWALAGQQLVSQYGLALLLLKGAQWHPKAVFSKTRVGTLFVYGWKLLVSSLLDTGFSNLVLLVIGRKFDAGTLAYYNRGKQFPELVMNAVNGSIQSVMLPVLSEEQDNKAQAKALTRRSLMVSSFLVLPLMAGLAAAASPLVRVLLGDKWLPCVPFMQLCCVDFALYPIHTMNLQAMNAMGRSDIFLRLELIKKSYGLAILLISAFCFQNIMAIAVGMVLSSLISVFVNIRPNAMLLDYGAREQLRDILPPLALSLGMFGAVYAMNLLPLSPLPLLMAQAAVGVILYAGLSALFRLESGRLMLETAKELKRRRTAA